MVNQLSSENQQASTDNTNKQEIAAQLCGNDGGWMTLVVVHPTGKKKDGIAKFKKCRGSKSGSLAT